MRVVYHTIVNGIREIERYRLRRVQVIRRYCKIEQMCVCIPITCLLYSVTQLLIPPSPDDLARRLDDKRREHLLPRLFRGQDANRDIFQLEPQILDVCMHA